MKTNLLKEAIQCWEAGDNFRRNRTRCKDFTFGRQWNDVVNVNGRQITEYQLLQDEGNFPLKNNLIRRIVRNITGVFRSHLDDFLKKADSLQHSREESENIREIYARSFEEFLISGLAVHKKWIGERNGIQGIHTYSVSQDRFFYNPGARDCRGDDIESIGEIHEVGFRQWCREFVVTRDEYERASRLFSERDTVKVIELWRREMRERVLYHDHTAGRLRVAEGNSRHLERVLHNKPFRWILQEVWRYYFIDDQGNILLEGDSPYAHKSHPYVMRGYPFLDGEIQSLVGDIIDQQKYTNRIITLYDWVVRGSAKGVLLVPKDSLIDGNIDDFAKQWSRSNGIIVYNGRTGVPKPEQINGGTMNNGIADLLEIQLKMLEDVSGVNGILRGNSSGTNMSGTLYENQTRNAMYSLSDIFATFLNFMEDCRQKEKLL